MRKLSAIFLLLISTSSYAQTLKEKLQGNWVCTQILDSEGTPALGKFGKSDEYLKFSFRKGTLAIIEAPFDVGLKIPITFGRDYIDLFPQTVVAIPEKRYIVKSVDSAQMVLATTNKEGNPIAYHFANQELLGRKMQPVNVVLDYKTIVIKHILYKGADGGIKVKGTNRSFEYRISNAPENLYPSPIFNDPATASLASNFTHYLNLPKKFISGETTDELIIAFDISKNGAENIRIVKSLDSQIDEQLVTLIQKTRKRWETLVLNGKPIVSTIKLHFVFIPILE